MYKQPSVPIILKFMVSFGVVGLLLNIGGSLDGGYLFVDTLWWSIAGVIIGAIFCIVAEIKK
jgi:uncharacterized membrane protein